LSTPDTRILAASRDPLDAVPVVPADVRAERHGSGLLLERRVAAEGRFGSFVERTLGLRRTRRFELDELGRSFFQAVDGARTLLEIAGRLQEQRGLDPEESRRAVRAFTETLVSRGLLALRLDG
jgi:hypothetical protein